MNKTRLVIVNGYPRSGKDTFVRLVREHGAENLPRFFMKSISTVDIIKDIASDYLGWNGDKTPYWREKLSNMKDFFDKEFGLSLQSIKSELYKIDSLSYYIPKVLCVMVREPEQIACIVNMMNSEYSNSVECITVCVNRDLCDKSQINHADKNVEGYLYDVYINNNGTLKDLKKSAEGFLKHIMEGK